MTNYDKHSAEATSRLYAPAQSLKIGDFVWMQFVGDKQLNLLDFVEWSEDHGTKKRLCKVADIVEVSNDFEFAHGWMSEEFAAIIKDDGGNESDDVEQKQIWEYTQEEIGTFYSLVTILRAPNGKYIAVNREGYDYCRVVYLPANYGEILCEEIIQARREKEEYTRILLEQCRKEREAQAEAYKARQAELRAKYRDLREITDIYQPFGRTLAANLRKWLKINFPDVPCKVKLHQWDYYPYEYSATIKINGDITTKVAIGEAFCNEWHQSMPTGTESDYENKVRARVFEELFGSIRYIDTMR